VSKEEIQVWGWGHHFSTGGVGEKRGEVDKDVSLMNCKEEYFCYATGFHRMVLFSFAIKNEKSITIACWDLFVLLIHLCSMIQCLKGYDPLAFAVEETHKRGLQVEAWLNPYRISATANFAAFHPMHVAVQHPEWVMRYDNGSMILNPGTYLLFWTRM
jgi:hypothetical protein